MQYNGIQKNKVKFSKMQGCGNDYIFFNCFEQYIPNPQELAVRLSDRRRGIGGDGIILICPSHTADAKMRMFNLDGSEGKMCGNGIRCVGKYIYEHGIAVKETLKIETLSGVKSLKPYLHGGRVTKLCVDMGAALFAPEKIPVRLGGGRVIARPIEIDGKTYKINCVAMGNPHCVVFVPCTDILDLKKTGPGFENNKIFPERVNTEFVTVVDRTTLKMRVWERGSKETLACGTGACAAAAAAVENGFCDKNTDITVKLKGGDLIIRCTDNTVYLTGNAVTVFEGEIEL